MRYQNSLAPDNKAAFDACDGLFTNYWWGAKQLAQSVALAGARRLLEGAPINRVSYTY